MAGHALNRCVTAMLEACCRRLWGYAPGMIPLIVARKGAFGAVAWFMANMPRYLLTMHVLGAVRAHLACLVISLHNRCIYCSYGHAYALELIYFRDHDRLFPLDAGTLAGWLDLEPRRLRERMRTVLEQAGLHGEALWVDRILDLATGEQAPVDGDEARVAHLVEMVGSMNEIATAGHVQPDGAQNPINKNVRLKARCAALRAEVAHAQADGAEFGS